MRSPDTLVLLGLTLCAALVQGAPFRKRVDDVCGYNDGHTPWNNGHCSLVGEICTTATYSLYENAATPITVYHQCKATDCNGADLKCAGGFGDNCQCGTEFSTTLCADPLVCVRDPKVAPNGVNNNHVCLQCDPDIPVIEGKCYDETHLTACECGKIVPGTKCDDNKVCLNGVCVCLAPTGISYPYCSGPVAVTAFDTATCAPVSTDCSTLGQVCLNGNCVGCTPGETRCTGCKTMEKCDAAGTWVSQTCDFCSTGVDQSQPATCLSASTTCLPGQQRCTGNSYFLRTCGWNGEYSFHNCTGVAADNVGFYDTAESCTGVWNANAGGWNYDTSLAGVGPVPCLGPKCNEYATTLSLDTKVGGVTVTCSIASTKALCQPCMNGINKCVGGDSAATCQSGTWGVGSKCPDNKICANALPGGLSGCALCAPGQQTCSGDRKNILTCNGAGSAWSSKTCSSPKLCTATATLAACV